MITNTEKKNPNTSVKIKIVQHPEVRDSTKDAGF